MAINKALAHSFAEAHASGELLVLPTVWDTWSAAIAVEAGARGLTIGSHPVANTIGRLDGEDMDFDQYLAITRRIVESVDVPVSVDVESGYGLAADELAAQVAETGAVGMNIEDVVHGEGGRVRTLQEHADYISGVRAALDRLDMELVINGRTDAVKLGTEQFEDPEAEAIARMKAMAEAGARSLYPVGVSEHEQIERLVAATSLPLNVTVDPVANTPGELATLTELGVRRATWGPKWQNAVSVKAAESLTAWL